jgi:NAD-dependent SIR2 family protein deacetylase
MSSSPSHRNLQPSTVEDFARDLKEARDNHRQIVPIVGAGLSADCGFPVIAAIVRYFGKLRSYIELSGPFTQPKKQKMPFLAKLFDDYQKKPWRFVEDFGWPDRFQLNYDLFTKLDSLRKTKGLPTKAEELIEVAVREGIDKLLPEVNKLGSRAYDELQRNILDIHGAILEKLKHQEEEPVEKRFKGKVEKRFKENESRSSAFDVVGDWRRLIQYFTNYKSDYADALFARFGATRQPGQGHRFLAFLVKYLAVPTIFTFNFDSLIEQALESEGIRPRVFAMERGGGLPHASLVHDLSIIKMHGSTHALLLDEQLDRPLSEPYLTRFDGLTKSNPLLLVVGCSEGDRRLRDLVAHVARESSVPPSALWLHYARQSPQFLNELGKDFPGQIRVCPTNNPGATLMHMHSWLTSCNPAGRVPYLAHVEQPIHLGKSELDKPESGAEAEVAKWAKEECFNVISAPADNLNHTASNELMKRANYWARKGHHFIWIDFESVHTFAGVVGSIIDQCRKTDPDLAPSVLPVEIDSSKYEVPIAEPIKLAAKRVARALKRTRYYLAFDGLETYVWPATTHHGLTHMAIDRGASVRLEKLVVFLKHLKGEPLGESKVGISVDGSTCRYSATESKEDLSKYLSLDDQVERLAPKDDVSASNTNAVNEPDAASRYRTVLEREPNQFRFEDRFEELAEDLPLVSLKDIPEEIGTIIAGNAKSNARKLKRARLALVLLNLSCFRRTRPLVAMRHLLEPLVGRVGDDGRHNVVDSLLRQFSRQKEGNGKKFIFLQQLEGGGYWFNHKIRDEIYARNTRYTKTDHLKKCLENRANTGLAQECMEERAKHCRNATFQLFLIAMTHRRVARTWYTTFTQSQDTFAFLEYTYHRISSIRSLAKLRALAQVALNEEEQEIAKAILTGIAKCGELLRLIDPLHPPITELEFEKNGPFSPLLKGVEADQPLPDTEKIKELESVLMERHVRELRTLHRAWTRSEVTLRTQLPAEQLLHWCDELLKDDLVHRCNRVVIKYVPKGRKSAKQFSLIYHKFTWKKEKDKKLVDPGLEKKEIARFREYLRDLQVKLWIERSDYDTCIEERRRHLAKEENPAAPIPKIETEETFLKSCDVVQCHQLLDIVNCKLRSAQELSFDDDDLSKRKQEAVDLLESVKRRLDIVEDELKHKKRPKDDRSNQSNLNEAQLRWAHLNAECQIGRLSVFSHAGFSGNPEFWQPGGADLVGARVAIGKGLDLIRTKDTRTYQSPRSAVVDPAADGTLYLQYRSVFHLLRGRVEWLTQPKSTEAFEKAFRFFEMARGGLGDKNPLTSALIELNAVEALLGRARGELFEVESKTAWNLAAGMYDSAGRGLRRAREFLIASRRNAIAQKLFFRLATQYHSDRLFLEYARLEKIVADANEQAITGQGREEVRRTLQKMSGKFLVRFRSAYGTLLTSLALYLPTSSAPGSEPKNRSRWLSRMWWELTLCGYATGRLVIQFNDERTEDEKDKLADSNYVISQSEMAEQDRRDRRFGVGS